VVLRQLLAYAGGVIPMLTSAFGDNPAIDEVFIFGSWAARYNGESGPPPNDVDVAVVSESLTRFDLAEARLDLENESKLSINLFVFEPDNERLPELRAAGVPVFARGACTNGMERVTGIEPAFSAWEADVLPLNYTREGGTEVSVGP
jgi:predicted nucleotidyltransferase